MNRTLIILSLICLSIMLKAQNLTEAVRYSYLNNYGTAGLAGLAGAGGAVGGDMGVLTINPSSIAEYRNSVLVITPNIYSVSSDASLLDQETTTTDLNSRIGMGSIGVVFASSSPGKRLSTNNLAITWNTHSFFREKVFYSGLTQGSITQRFVEQANGLDESNLDPFEGYLAYATDAIFDLNQDNFYDSDFKPTTVVDKNQDISRFGRMNEINLTWGGKIDETVNFGIGVGIPIVSFEENKTYVEEDQIDDFIPTFNRLEFRESLLTTGAGINVKAGIQSKVGNLLRVGLSMQSPTLLTLNDSYSTAMQYDYTWDSQRYITDEESPEGSFKYRLITPWKATGSIAGIIKTSNIFGFVNLDAEYIDYTNNQFDFQKFSNSSTDAARETEVNDNVLLQLTNGINLRIGADIGTQKFRVKGGVAMIQSPYDLQEDADIAYSGGLGFRGDSYFLDLSITQRKRSEGYVPYLVLDSEDNQQVAIDQKLTNIGVTLGFKF